jgi:hypothetical protein
MGRAREIQRLQAVALQNLHGWGLPLMRTSHPLEHVAHTMLSVPEVEGYSMDTFNDRWARFVKCALNPLTKGRWVRFMELQKRGAPHAHILHYAENIRTGWSHDRARGKGRDGWARNDGGGLAGTRWREVIHVIDECARFGFGWNSTEPLRGTGPEDAEAMVNYLVAYLVKARFVGRPTIFQGRRLVTFGQGCIERHGCRHDARYPEGHEKRWVASTPALFETVRGSADREKRLMKQIYCSAKGIAVDELGAYAEFVYPHVAAKSPGFALKLLWEEDILPMYREEIEPF